MWGAHSHCCGLFLVPVSGIAPYVWGLLPAHLPSLEGRPLKGRALPACFLPSQDTGLCLVCSRCSKSRERAWGWSGGRAVACSLPVVRPRIPGATHASPSSVSPLYKQRRGLSSGRKDKRSEPLRSFPVPFRRSGPSIAGHGPDGVENVPKTPAAAQGWCW